MFLFFFRIDFAFSFLDESPFVHVFKKQISHLVVTIVDDTGSDLLNDLATDVYGRIFTFFTNLVHLDFVIHYTPRHPTLHLNYLPSNICFSSSIVHLSIRVLFFEDCLQLLDGRLPQMNTFIVTIGWCMSHSSTTIDNTVKTIIRSGILYSFYRKF